MARVGESTGIHDKVEKHAASWYEQRRIPEAFKNQHPLVLDKAEELCDGDWRRCVVDEQGVLTVYNRPMWEPE